MSTQAERNAALSDRMKQNWADPDWRERRKAQVRLGWRCRNAVQRERNGENPQKLPRQPYRPLPEIKEMKRLLKRLL